MLVSLTQPMLFHGWDLLGSVTTSWRLEDIKASYLWTQLTFLYRWDNQGYLGIEWTSKKLSKQRIWTKAYLGHTTSKLCKYLVFDWMLVFYCSGCCPEAVVELFEFGILVFPNYALQLNSMSVSPIQVAAHTSHQTQIDFQNVAEKRQSNPVLWYWTLAFIFFQTIPAPQLARKGGFGGGLNKQSHFYQKSVNWKRQRKLLNLYLKPNIS